MVRAPLLAALVLVQPAPAPAGQEPPSGEAVNAAIDRGVAYLLASQNRDGSWGVDLNERVAHFNIGDGSTALALYTLLKCGLTAEHPALQRGLAFLLEQVPTHTYSLGMQLAALGAAGDPAHARRMRELVEILLDLQARLGWDYPGLGRADLSNTQVAALGLRGARLAGVDLPRSIWSELVETTLRHQEGPREFPGGGPKEKRRLAGFAYEVGGTPSASMTTAGLTVLGVAVEEPGLIDSRLAARVDEARELGLAWLEANFAVAGNPGGEGAWHFYYLYGLERIGAFFGHEKIGPHDWYDAGAAQLLSEQRPEGAWRQDGRSRWPPAPMPVANTCFALLFLRRATLSQPGAARSAFLRMEEERSEVWVRVDAKRTWTLWLSGFSPGALARSPGGLRIEAVEWLVDGQGVGRVPGDPGKPWMDERYAIQHTPSTGGEHTVECLVSVRAGEPGASPRVLRSLPLVVTGEPVLEPWMLEYPRAQRANLLAGAAVQVRASTEESEFHPAAEVLDGLQGSAWLAQAGDPLPWIALELERPVRAREIWLSPAGASESLRATCAELVAAEVRVNDDKPLVVQFDPDPRLKTRVALPRSVPLRRLEVRLIDGTDTGGRCRGLAEIELR